MKAAWERVVEKNTTKTVYKTKDQREWERVKLAYEVIIKYFNPTYYDRIDKSKQGELLTMAAVLTRRMGGFWKTIVGRITPKLQGFKSSL